MDVILFGPPACGKGTQSEFLKKLGFRHLSTGEMFRTEVRRKSKLGQHIAQELAEGRLMPDYLTIGMVEEEIMTGGPKPICFDGFPRTIVQAHALDDILRRAQRRIGAVFSIDAADDELIRRMHNRAAAAKVARAEDNDDAFRNRMSRYGEAVGPILRHYGDRVISVNGMMDVWETSEMIREEVARLRQQEIGDQAA